MDQVLLAASAATLENILLQYVGRDAEASALHAALAPLIEDARKGKIATPVEWRDVPGGYAFSEGRLRQYADLEQAYAAFKIEVTGGESPVLRALRLNT